MVLYRQTTSVILTAPQGQGGSNFETIFSTRVFATIFSLFEMFVLTISSPYQKKESYVKV